MQIHDKRTILVNLLSEQRLPNYIVALEEQPEEVWSLCTPEFRKDVDRFKTLTGIPHRQIPVNAYDLEGVCQRLTHEIKHLPSDVRVVINFTGGTKIMAVAAVFAGIAARLNHRIELVYVETTSSRLDRFGFDSTGRFQSFPSKPIGIHIPFEAYAGLLGEPIKPGYLTEITPEIAQRLPTAEMLLHTECNDFFQRMKGAFQVNNRNRTELKSVFAAEFRSRGGKGRIEWSPKGGALTLPGGTRFEIPGPDAARFFCGGWLEEYCFSRLAAPELPEEKKFKQVLLRVTLEIKPESLRNPDVKLKDKTELDVVVCNGVRAAIIECKSGRVVAEDLHRLSAITRYLLGSHGIALLATRFPLSPKEVEIAANNKIRVVVGRSIAILREKLAQWFKEGEGRKTENENGPNVDKSL